MFIFQCKGCRNPHRPNGEKRPHSVAVSSASQKNKSSGHGGKKGKLYFLAIIEGHCLYKMSFKILIFSFIIHIHFSREKVFDSVSSGHCTKPNNSD